MYLNTYAVNDSLLNAGIVRLSGDLDATATAAGHFSVDLQGDAPAATSSASGSLALEVRCAAAVTARATASGGIYNVRVYAVNGTAFNWLAFNAPNPVDLVAAASAAATASAGLVRTAPLAAEISGTATAAATVAGSQTLAADASASAAVAATATYTRQLAAGVSASAATSGAAVYYRNLAGSSSGSAAASASVQRVGQYGHVEVTYTPYETRVTAAAATIHATVTDPKISLDVTTTSIYANATQ